MITDLVQRVLADSDNELGGIARAFQITEEACWHIDRHVLGVSEAQRPSAALIHAACVAAVALARQWAQQRSNVQGTGVNITSPLVVIDDEWLAGAPAAPPPHVYICLARDKEALQPVRHDDAAPRASSASAIVDSLLTGGGKLLRLEGAFEGEPGAWIIELPER